MDISAPRRAAMRRGAVCSPLLLRAGLLRGFLLSAESLLRSLLRVVEGLPRGLLLRVERLACGFLRVVERLRRGLLLRVERLQLSLRRIRMLLVKRRLVGRLLSLERRARPSASR